MATLIDQHRAVQAVAKAVLAELGKTIVSSDTERTIAERAVAMMTRRGIKDTWYYDCPAFVLLGSRSCLSVSGREYAPSEEAVGDANLVTVDLSPMQDGIWGDCARSFVIENGSWVLNPSCIAFARGAHVERALHEAMLSFVAPTTTFEELFHFSNTQIEQHGFENLDVLGNVGHSIESARDARRYIERGNRHALGTARLFTFEPHIKERGSPWGFKHENIYYFNGEGRALEL